MSTYKTQIEIDSIAHKHLFNSKKRPGESFNEVLKRELGLSEDPEESDDVEAEAEVAS